MEILAYTSILFALGGLFSALLYSNPPYYKSKISKAINGLNIAYEVALQKAEELEILKHKWLESEKVGYDIGMKSAQESWNIIMLETGAKARESCLIKFFFVLLRHTQKRCILEVKHKTRVLV